MPQLYKQSPWVEKTEQKKIIAGKEVDGWILGRVRGGMLAWLLQPIINIKRLFSVRH